MADAPFGVGVRFDEGDGSAHARGHAGVGVHVDAGRRFRSGAGDFRFRYCRHLRRSCVGGARGGGAQGGAGGGYGGAAQNPLKVR